LDKTEETCKITTEKLEIVCKENDELKEQKILMCVKNAVLTIFDTSFEENKALKLKLEEKEEEIIQLKKDNLIYKEKNKDLEEGIELEMNLRVKVEKVMEATEEENDILKGKESDTYVQYSRILNINNKSKIEIQNLKSNLDKTEETCKITTEKLEIVCKENDELKEQKILMCVKNAVLTIFDTSFEENKALKLKLEEKEEEIIQLKKDNLIYKEKNKDLEEGIELEMNLRVKVEKVMEATEEENDILKGKESDTYVQYSRILNINNKSKIEIQNLKSNLDKTEETCKITTEKLEIVCKENDELKEQKILMCVKNAVLTIFDTSFEENKALKLKLEEKEEEIIQLKKDNLIYKEKNKDLEEGIELEMNLRVKVEKVMEATEEENDILKGKESDTYVQYSRILNINNKSKIEIQNLKSNFVFDWES
jgi:hypothetical protein